MIYAPEYHIEGSTYLVVGDKGEMQRMICMYDPWQQPTAHAMHELPLDGDWEKALIEYEVIVDRYLSGQDV